MANTLGRLLGGRTQDEVDALERTKHERLVASARIAEARRQSGWQEVDDLVARPGGFYVSVATDRVYRSLGRGLAFEPGSAAVVADGQRLAFVVDGDSIEFYEPFGRETWTERLERKAGLARA